MKKAFKPLVAVLAIVLSGSLLTACHHHSRGHGDPEKIGRKMEKSLDHALSKIGTTDEQNEKIALITGKITEDAVQTHKLYGRDNLGRLGMVAEILSDTPDPDLLHRQVDEKAQAMIEFGHRTLDRFIEISAILTPEQRTELKQRFERAHVDKKQ